MNENRSKIHKKMEVAVISLLTQATTAEAAKAAGISEVTLWRWQKEERFQQAFKAAKRQALETALFKLQSATNEAVDVLQHIMLDKTSKASDRVSAAKAILSMSFHAVHMEELESTIIELTKKVEELMEGNNEYKTS